MVLLVAKISGKWCKEETLAIETHFLPWQPIITLSVVRKTFTGKLISRKVIENEQKCNQNPKLYDNYQEDVKLPL